MGLTEDAKNEIAAAIAIVRADKFEQHARSVLAKHTPKDPPKDPLIEDDPPVNPPPPKDPKDPPTDPPTDPPKTRSRYWGEILDE